MQPHLDPLAASPTAAAPISGSGWGPGTCISATSSRGFCCQLSQSHSENPLCKRGLGGLGEPVTWCYSPRLTLQQALTARELRCPIMLTPARCAQGCLWVSAQPAEGCASAIF